MEIKTVWHWKNLIKTLLFVIAVATIEGIIAVELHFPQIVNYAIGFATGIIIVLFTNDKWPAYHFE